MMPLEQTQTDQMVETVTLTESAATAVQSLMDKRNLQGYALRVYVSGGGCSGMQYGMALDGNVGQTDSVFEQHGIKLVVDEVSIDYLRGSTVDYVDTETGSGFKIDNPNAVSSCGCSSGESGGSCGCGNHN
jgi:iron-sulfur cluster assembly protein